MSKWEWYLSAAGVGKSFLRLLLQVIGNTTDLNEFDRMHIVMARRLGTSISETAQLINY